MEENRKDPGVGEGPNIWDFSSLGIEFAFIIIVCIYAGQYLDKKFALQPWGILISVIVGFAYGLFYIIARTSRLKEKKKK